MAGIGVSQRLQPFELYLINHSIGPVLMTVGPWKPIRLETYSTRISDLDIRIDITEDLAAVINVAFTLTSSDKCVASVQIKKPNGGLLIGGSNIPVTTGSKQTEFKCSAGTYDLWWPVGYGAQPLYTVEVKIADEVSNLLVSLFPMSG